MTTNSLSLILPTYNEAENITLLIKAILKLPDISIKEIIIVDDNSPDDTANIVKNYFSNNPRVRLFIRKTDRGLAKSILFGIKKANASFVVVMDTDFNHDPLVICQMIKHISKADMVIGSRYIKGGGMENRIRFILSLIYNQIIRFVLHLSTKDNLSGYFIINRKKLLSLELEKIFTGYGDYFIRLISACQDNHFSILEIPVYYKNRTYGISKSKFFPMFLDYTKTVMDIIKNK